MHGGQQDVNAATSWRCICLLLPHLNVQIACCRWCYQSWTWCLSLCLLCPSILHMFCCFGAGFCISITNETCSQLECNEWAVACSYLYAGQRSCCCHEAPACCKACAFRVLCSVMAALYNAHKVATGLQWLVRCGSQPAWLQTCNAWAVYMRCEEQCVVHLRWAHCFSRDKRHIRHHTHSQECQGSGDIRLGLTRPSSTLPFSRTPTVILCINKSNLLCVGAQRANSHSSAWERSERDRAWQGTVGKSSTP